MKNLYFLAIEGVIGAGKTSLARLMAEKLNARLVLEKFEENPFLEDFTAIRKDTPFKLNSIFS